MGAMSLRQIMPRRCSQYSNPCHVLREHAPTYRLMETRTCLRSLHCQALPLPRDLRSSSCCLRRQIARRLAGASNQASQDEANDESHEGSCETTTTIGGGTTPTTIGDNDADEQGDNHQGDSHQSDDHHAGTSPTTVGARAWSFGEQRDGGHHDGSSGDSNSSGRDHGGASGSGGGN
jgi:hypothetical protein